MEREETPIPTHWNDELQEQLENRLIWSKNRVDCDMEELTKNTLAFFNDLKYEYNL